MTSASTRVWTLASLFAMIVVIALGWFLGIAPQLADAARSDAERRDVQAQNEAARAAIAQLESDFERIDEFRAELDALRAQFPMMPEYDVLIEELTALLVANGVTLDSLTIGEPSPASPDAVIDENGQVESGTLLRIPLTLGVQGGVANALALAQDVQLSERFALVTGVSISDGATPADTSAVLTITLYVISGDPAEGATPVTPGDDASTSSAENGESDDT